MVKIMVVEDNRDLRELFGIALRDNGFRVIEAKDGNDALDQLGANAVDLIITDVMMPGMNGIDLTDCLRKGGYDMPVLMITVKDDYRTKKEGFGAGADDYMVKPVDIEEMILRVKALLRRARINTEKKLVVGSTEINFDSMTVTREDSTVELPQKEFLLLTKLLSYPNTIFTRKQIMDEIWGMETESDERTINTHVHRLRNRFEDNPDFRIVTVKNLGYKAVRK